MASMTGKVVPTGKLFVAQSKSGKKTGPSNKNLGPSRTARPNTAPTIRSLAGMSIKGPDLGAGGK